MSETLSNETRTETQGSRVPRAVIHKRILDVAEDRPDASMESIAADVSCATVDLVEQVLEEYGDPASDSAESDVSDESGASSAGTNTDESASIADTSASPDSDGLSSRKATAESSLDANCATHETNQSTSVNEDDTSTVNTILSANTNENIGAKADESDETGVSTDSVAPSDDSGSDGTDAPEVTDEEGIPPLTMKQQTTLCAIAQQPNATQAEIADRLGVTPPTVSQRVNSIDGYEWATRHDLLETLITADALESGVATDTIEEAQLTTPAHGTRTSNEGTNDSTEMTDTNHRTRNTEKTPRGEQGADTNSNAESEGDANTVADLKTEINGLVDRVETLERQIKDTTPSGLAVDPTLAHKVIHASMVSDRITEDEELQLIQAVLESSSDA